MNIGEFGAAPRIRPVPQQRIVEKLDDYMSRRDYAGAERHLLYWLEEARLGGDRRGELTLRNELVGHYRKTGERDKAFACADAALALLEDMDFGDSISAATTYVNVATAMNAFGENARALELFGQARALYEAAPSADPKLVGGLYNNMALTCTALGRYDEADKLYDLALDREALAPNGELEQAITCLNRADLVAARDGLEKGEARIFELLERAAALLRMPGPPRDGYYAFVCEKCAPTFDYYGWFADAAAFKGEAERIYGRGT